MKLLELIHQSRAIFWKLCTNIKRKNKISKTIYVIEFISLRAKATLLLSYIDYYKNFFYYSLFS